MRNLLIFTLIMAIRGGGVFAQADTTNADSSAAILKPVTVTAGLVTINPAKAPYSIAIIDSADLVSLPVRSVTDALMYVPGVDFRQRGAVGIQGDVTIRGGTFEQAAIMVDGVRLNDVQTGHNTASLPFLPSDVERIEVIKGGAARFFGAGALDGAVNFVLKQPSGPITIKGSITAGDASLLEGRLSASGSTGSIGHIVSAQYLTHNGWQPNTDAKLASAMYHASLVEGATTASVMFGVNAKEFGANGFYSPRFPDQWEKLTTYLGIATLSTPISDAVVVNVRASGRVNFDEFLLKRNDPSFYKNNHRTDQYQIQSGLRWYHEQGSTSILLEGGHDAINSTNLGVHDRFRGNVMLEHVITIDRLRLSGGLGLLSFSDRSPLITGGIESAISFLPMMNVNDVMYASVQRSGRIPTYTDLYYQDPQTTGNPYLVPEHAITAEAGYRRTALDYNVQVALFSRFGTDLIDYAIDPVTGKAKAENITTVNIVGIDASGSINVNVAWCSKIRLGLLLQDVSSSAPSNTRYVADNLNLQAVVDTRWSLPFQLEGAYVIRVLNRVTDPTAHVVQDIRLSHSFAMLQLVAEATNLFSAQFIETGWAVIPPRWFRVSVLVC